MLEITTNKDGGATIEVGKFEYYVLMNSLYEAKESYKKMGLEKMSEETFVLWHKFVEGVE